MSKAQRVRAQNARERIAAQQAAARKAEFRRRAAIAGGSVVVVLAVVIAVILYATNRSSPPPAAGNNGTMGTVLSASVSSDITSVPASTQYGVGAGSVGTWLTNDEGGAPPLVPISNSPLTSGGKPEMLYIGAEFCPFCAAMRWSMAVALSRFGHFTTALRGFHSSPTDSFPNTPTLTFYKAGYTSKYLTFTPVENEDINRNTLQATTSAQMALWEKYDSSSDGVGYPFIDFGNKVVVKTPIVDPSILAGKSWAQVAAALHEPTSPIAQAELGAANYVTAAICKMTGNAPTAVCSASTIQTMEKGI
jgi:thiol-disulfide isomerase/thioredoxin